MRPAAGASFCSTSPRSPRSSARSATRATRWCRSRCTSRTAAPRSRSGWPRARRPTTSGTPSPTARPSARGSRRSVDGSRATPTDGAGGRSALRRFRSTVTGPPRFAEELGIPGLFDVHTHFLPPRVMAKVRHQFDTAGPLIGRAWPLAYRGDDDDLVATLRGFGVRRFSALAYAHRPGMAEFLNDWSFGFADRTPGCLRSATFYPEPDAASYVAARLAAGAEIFKVHVQVGAFDVRDPLLADVWGLLEDAGTPVVIHAGSGPVATPYTGPEPVADLLARFPRLALVIAHLGAPEYAEFVALAETYERVCLDTTMVFTPFFDEIGAAFPPALLPRLRELRPKVLLGSDFPNIPYDYDSQLSGLTTLGLGDDWLRAGCWGNGAGIFGAQGELAVARSVP